MRDARRVEAGLGVDERCDEVRVEAVRPRLPLDEVLVAQRMVQTLPYSRSPHRQDRRDREDDDDGCDDHAMVRERMLT